MMVVVVGWCGTQEKHEIQIFVQNCKTLLMKSHKTLMFHWELGDISPQSWTVPRLPQGYRKLAWDSL
jgi:hypothetical protein